jgi:hypothetical protein
MCRRSASSGPVTASTTPIPTRLIWVGIPQLTVPNASEADLRDVSAETRWQVNDNRRQLQNDARTTLL